MQTRKRPPKRRVRDQATNLKVHMSFGCRRFAAFKTCRAPRRSPSDDLAAPKALNSRTHEQSALQNPRLRTLHFREDNRENDEIPESESIIGSQTICTGQILQCTLIIIHPALDISTQPSHEKIITISAHEPFQPNPSAHIEPCESKLAKNTLKSANPRCGYAKNLLENEAIVGVQQIRLIEIRKRTRVVLHHKFYNAPRPSHKPTTQRMFVNSSLAMKFHPKKERNTPETLNSEGRENPT